MRTKAAKQLHQPIPELAKAQAMPESTRRKAGNLHRKPASEEKQIADQLKVAPHTR
ncbi:MAG: hypothetical protein ABIS50_11560 [Luteolibacter sp.]|uniref:hypothetical protein n=1 Tax=Luteolibacter sp. TaxID=1962973 RepID=UPI0032663A93